MTALHPIVLIHGGGFDGRCWDALLPHLDGPALAVDLPGRGAHPMPLTDVTPDRCAESVVADIDAAGFDEVMLVGHSLAGVSLPATVGLLGARVRHVVFVAATVPDDGCSAYDMLDPSIQVLIRAADPTGAQPMDASIARMVLGDDLTEEQFAWCVDRLVAEALRLTTEPVDLAPLRDGPPRTWVRTQRDLIVPPDRQSRYAETVAPCPVVDLDAGHMAMVSRPAELAAILYDVAAGRA
jgi:pimeloyl-ACP methyl ester carboxylesterase